MHLRTRQSVRQRRRPRSGRTDVRIACGLLLIVATIPGCLGNMLSLPSFGPGRTGKPVFPYDITEAALVSRLNENADRVDSWIARDCSIRVRMPNGMPARLKATIACQEPRNFRLVADGSLVVRTDVGSNADQCWWWAQPGENVMYYVNHRDMSYVRDHPVLKKSMAMPFEPEWLMQVLGVLPIDEDQVTLVSDPEPGFANLVSEYPTPDGRMFRRIMVVDLHLGRIVAHRIMDDSRNTIARARLLDYATTDGASLPNRIELDWPTMKTSLSIRIDDLAVNTKLQPNLWQPLQDKSMAVVDLGEHLRRMDAHRSSAGLAAQTASRQPRPGMQHPVYEADGDDGVESISWDNDPVYSPPKRKWFHWPFGRR